jgi:hypothetical protein
MKDIFSHDSLNIHFLKEYKNELPIILGDYIINDFYDFINYLDNKLEKCKNNGFIEVLDSYDFKNVKWGNTRMITIKNK